MQKAILVVLVITFGLVSANIIWTNTIFQDISGIIDSAKDSLGADMEFAKTAQGLAFSPVVERFTFIAGGDIENINGRTLTLVKEESVLEIPVAMNAEIVRQTARDILPETISFQDLEVGDEVSCSVEMGKNGIFTAYRVKLMVSPINQ
jgi:hypothetical protein